MILVLLAIFGFGCLICLDRFYTQGERELKRLENELWEQDARSRYLLAEGWTPIEDYLPEPEWTVDFLRAVDGIKIHQAGCMLSGNTNSWDWLKNANHFTHWRYNEAQP